MFKWCRGRAYLVKLLHRLPSAVYHTCTLVHTTAKNSKLVQSPIIPSSSPVYTSKMATPGEKAVYTLGHHSSVVNSHARRTAQDSAAFLLPHLKPHFTVLDLGCGPGTITADLALLVPQGKVTGIDFSAAVIENARSHAQSRGITNCVFETVVRISRIPLQRKRSSRH